MTLSCYTSGSDSLHRGGVMPLLPSVACYRLHPKGAKTGIAPRACCPSYLLLLPLKCSQLLFGENYNMLLEF